MAHWTAESPESFIRRVTFDFWTQIQKRMDALPLTQSQLAAAFGISESAVSQTLNNSRNPTLLTLFNYAAAAKLKFAIVAYEDSDPTRGPLNSEIFTALWEKAGKPHTFAEVKKLPSIFASATTTSLAPVSRKGVRVAGFSGANTGIFLGSTMAISDEWSLLWQPNNIRRNKLPVLGTATNSKELSEAA